MKCFFIFIMIFFFSFHFMMCLQGNEMISLWVRNILYFFLHSFDVFIWMSNNVTYFPLWNKIKIAMRLHNLCLSTHWLCTHHKQFKRSKIGHRESYCWGMPSTFTISVKSVARSILVTHCVKYNTLLMKLFTFYYNIIEFQWRFYFDFIFISFFFLRSKTKLRRQVD